MSDLLLMTWTFLWLSLLCVGGGLGVIPEMQRQVVANHQWVTAREFVDGYTLAQLTPGPTMLVVAFVGYRAHGLLGALLATVAMFLPTSLIVVLVAEQCSDCAPTAGRLRRSARCCRSASGCRRPARTRWPGRRCTTSPRWRWRSSPACSSITAAYRRSSSSCSAAWRAGSSCDGRGAAHGRHHRA